MRSLILFVTLAILSGAPSARAQSLSNRRAPSFSLPDTALKQYDILDYRGKWLLLDFMQTECPHCKDLSKKLEPLKKKYAGKLEILSIVITPPATQQTVAKYMADTSTTGPIVFDSGQVTISYFKATPQNSSFDTPHLFAINPQGTIVKDWSQPEVDLPGFLADLERVIAAPAPAAPAKGAKAPVK